jgi:DNA-directed RNA polymerase specialized sigma24 family protein
MAVSVDGLLSPRGFERLLDQLHADRDTAGRTYEQLRRRLVRFFEGRRCAFPEEHADETLNRVARKLDAGETIQDVTTYVIGIARMIVKEAARSASREAALQAASRTPDHVSPLPDPASVESTRLLDCLHGCLDHLAPPDRDLIVQYYQDEKRAKIRSRKDLATKLGVEMNALRLRAFRIRAALEACVERCAGQSSRNGMGGYASTT